MQINCMTFVFWTFCTNENKQCLFSLFKIQPSIIYESYTLECKVRKKLQIWNKEKYHMSSFLDSFLNISLFQFHSCVLFLSFFFEYYFFMFHPQIFSFTLHFRIWIMIIPILSYMPICLLKVNFNLILHYLSAAFYCLLT